MVKNSPALEETRIPSLGQENFLEKGMETHSSILAWRLPWTEESGRLQSVGLQRVRYNWATNTFILGEGGFCIQWLMSLWEEERTHTGKTAMWRWRQRLEYAATSQGTPTAPRSLKSQGRTLPLCLQRDHGLLDTLILDVYPWELWGNISWCFKSSSLW